MSEVAERYAKVSAEFTQRVRAVPSGAWENPAPCEGWVARDVVRHLVDWVPSFFGTWDVDIPAGPSVDDDPLAAWQVLDSAIQAALADPEVATRERDTRLGRSTFEQTIDMILTGDVLIHTWDLARAAGLDEALDADEVHKMFEAMVPFDEMLRQGDQFGPRVEVPDDSDEQTKLLAFTGRRP